MAENSENTISMVQKQIDTLKESLKYLETIEEKLKQVRREIDIFQQFLSLSSSLPTEKATIAREAGAVEERYRFKV